MKYTIVLSPSAPEQYIAESQALYGDLATDYLLNNEGTSSPHITIVQFDSPNEEIARQVWHQFCHQMEKEGFSPFAPNFTGLSLIEGRGPYSGTIWIELSVERGAIASIHNCALDILRQAQLKALNASGENFRPHLTLARVLLQQSNATFPKQSILSNPGEFYLAFGLSDSRWQLEAILESSR